MGGLRVRCVECGAETADAQFCVRCGAPAAQQQSVAADPAANAVSNAASPPSPPGKDSVNPSSHARVGQQPSKPAPGPEVGGAILVEWVETKQFSTTRLRPGYDQEEVDTFLGAIRDAFLGVREPSLMSDEIRDNQFSTTQFRPGYDTEEVDAFLDEAESRLRMRCAEARPVNGGEVGDAELAGPTADPWRDLAVAQFTRGGDRNYRVKRKAFATECESAWRNFGQEPGVYLRWGQVGTARLWAARYELRTAKQQTIASVDHNLLSTPPWHPFAGASLGERSFTVKEPRAARSLSPGLGEITDLTHRSWEMRAFVDEAGMPILYTSGRHYDHRAGARIAFPDQRLLRFPVRGTRPGNAIMTAVGQAGNKVARYRKSAEGWASVEITVHPNQKLTDELALAIAISAHWLGSYFKSN
jgi:DivIVA domain-containing protein